MSPRQLLNFSIFIRSRSHQRTSCRVDFDGWRQRDNINQLLFVHLPSFFLETRCTNDRQEGGGATTKACASNLLIASRSGTLVLLKLQKLENLGFLLRYFTAHTACSISCIIGYILRWPSLTFLIHHDTFQQFTALLLDLIVVNMCLATTRSPLRLQSL